MYILGLDLFLPIIVHIPFHVLNPFRHDVLISYMLLPDVGIWCNSLVCGNHTQHVLHHGIPPCRSYCNEGMGCLRHDLVSCDTQNVHGQLVGRQVQRTEMQRIVVSPEQRSRY